MDLCFFISDPDGYRRNRIEKEIEHLALLADIQKLEFLQCDKTETIEQLKEAHWRMLTIALISLDFDNAKEIGDCLYHNNPACRLIYYREGEANLQNLLPARPVWYWNCKEVESLKDIFHFQLEAIKKDPYYFYYSDRIRSLAVSLDTILYVYSLKRAVYLHTENGEYGPLPRSLDEIQKKLPDYGFTRVHQSFLVNNRYVRRLDKSTRTLYLVNEIEIPVSRALYEKAREIFGQNDGFNDQNDEIKDF